MEHTKMLISGEEVVGKECTKCREWKVLMEFNKRTKAKDGLRNDCKSCQAIARKKDYRANRDKQLAYNTKWRQENPSYYQEYKQQWEIENKENRRLIMQKRVDMVKNLPSDVSPDEIIPDYSCALTGQQLDRSELHVDHIVPYSVGHVGNVRYNVWMIAGYLNLSKGNRNVFEWARERGDIDLDRFNAVMTDIAATAGLTLEEYEAFVTWCHENPRDIDEVKGDNRHSIDIWRENYKPISKTRELFVNPAARATRRAAK
jgi:5-methylcytosine-specific restriction endonuclease McrA